MLFQTQRSRSLNDRRVEFVAVEFGAQLVVANEEVDEETVMMGTGGDLGSSLLENAECIYIGIVRDEFIEEMSGFAVYRIHI